MALMFTVNAQCPTYAVRSGTEFGKNSWLFNKSSEPEHDKATQTFTGAAGLSGRSSLTK